MASSIRSNADGTMSVLNGSGTEVANFPSTANAVSTTVATQGDVIGVGQTWQDVTASRAAGVTYTNTTGKPILVNIEHTIVSGSQLATITVGGVVACESLATGSARGTMSAIVPNGATYTLSSVSVLSKWSELR